MNATYVDQCDTIRTLTEEEMAVVSGGYTPIALPWVTQSNALINSVKTGFSAMPYSAFLPPSNTYQSSNWFYNQWWATRFTMQ